MSDAVCPLCLTSEAIARAEVVRLRAEAERLERIIRDKNSRRYRREVEAWDMEDGQVIVLGTHDTTLALAAFERYILATGPDDFGAWPDDVRRLMHTAEPRYVDPLVVDDEVWARESHSSEPCVGWLPYLFLASP